MRHQKLFILVLSLRARAVRSNSWLIVSRRQMCQWNFHSSATLRFCNFGFKSSDYGCILEPWVIPSVLYRPRFRDVAASLLIVASNTVARHRITTISRVNKHDSDSGTSKYFVYTLNFFSILRKTHKTYISVLTPYSKTEAKSFR